MSQIKTMKKYTHMQMVIFKIAQEFTGDYEVMDELQEAIADYADAEIEAHLNPTKRTMPEETS